MRFVVSLLLILAAVLAAPAQALASDVDLTAPMEMPAPMEVAEESEMEVLHIAPHVPLAPAVQASVRSDEAWTPNMARSTPPTPPPR